MVPAVIVNANNIMALTVLRALGRRGVPVICAFGKSKRYEPYYFIVSHSRFITKKCFFEEDENGSNLVQCLVDLARQTGEKCVLFPVSDGDMITVSRNRRLLDKNYLMLMPEHGMLETLLCKEKFCELSYRNDLPVPRTYLIRDESDIDKVQKGARFPCVIKPSWRSWEWLSKYGNQKVLHVRNPEELNGKYQEITRHSDRFILQEVIAGREDQIVCSFAYLNERSQPLALFLCRKLRQYPPRYGNTALAESVFEPEVAGLATRICKKLGLVGYASIEFKRDAEDGHHKIFEITASRPNRQAGLAEAAGVNIIHIWYRHLVGNPIGVNHYAPAVKWVSEVNDTRAFFEYLRAKEYSLKTWVDSYRNIRGWEVFAKDDLKPILALCVSPVLRLLHPAGSDG